MVEPWRSSAPTRTGARSLRFCRSSRPGAPKLTQRAQTRCDCLGWQRQISSLARHILLPFAAEDVAEESAGPGGYWLLRVAIDIDIDRAGQRIGPVSNRFGARRHGFSAGRPERQRLHAAIRVVRIRNRDAQRVSRQGVQNRLAGVGAREFLRAVVPTAAILQHPAAEENRLVVFIIETVFMNRLSGPLAAESQIVPGAGLPERGGQLLESQLRKWIRPMHVNRQRIGSLRDVIAAGRDLDSERLPREHRLEGQRLDWPDLAAHEGEVGYASVEARDRLRGSMQFVVKADLRMLL